MPGLSPTVSIIRKSSPRRFLDYITQKITLHHSDPSLDGLTYWRERILSVALTAGGGLSLLALVPAILLAFTRQLWVLLIGDGLALLLVGFLLFAAHGICGSGPCLPCR